jgi:hypothetical protein
MEGLNDTKLLNAAKIVILALILSVGISYLYAQVPGWDPPDQPPPAGNTPAPINVGVDDQIKSGRFFAFEVTGSNALCIGTDCRSTWPSGGISQWITNGADIYSGNSGDVGIGDTSPDGLLKLDVEGRVGATHYCDQNGSNCVAAGTFGGTTQIPTGLYGHCSEQIYGAGVNQVDTVCYSTNAKLPAYCRTDLPGTLPTGDGGYSVTGGYAAPHQLCSCPSPAYSTALLSSTYVSGSDGFGGFTGSGTRIYSCYKN